MRARLAAYYVAGESAPAAGELRELCRRRLPEHLVPSSFTEIGRAHV